jgi:hypothetical protein
VDQVASWLASENISNNMIQLFKNELITGETLFVLSKEDMGVIGIRTMGEKLLLVKLISELKDQWMMRVDGTEIGVDGVGVGGVWGVEVGRRSMVVMMEDGKGAPITDAPPSYSAS